MHTKSILACLVLFTAVSSVGPVSAEDSAFTTMAKIVMNLNHYPSADDKLKLKQITNSFESNEAEKTIASAVLNLQHQATASDKKKLMEISERESLPESTRVLAGIVGNINHKTSDADNRKLKEMMD